MDHHNPSPELSILIELLKSDVPIGSTSIIQNHGPKDIDWDRLAVLADRHGLYLQLSRAILNGVDCPDSVDCPESIVCPDSVVEKFRDGQRQRTLLNQILEVTLADICRAMDHADLPVIAFKGPVLDQLLFGTKRLRQYADLDIFLPPARIAEAAVLLKSMGYTTAVDTADPVRHPVLRFGGEMSFERTQGVSTSLDLHWGLFNKIFPACLTLAGFEQRLQTVSIGGHPIRTLSDTDLLVYACHHVSKHSCDELAAIKEIALLILRIPEASLLRLLNEAHRDGLDRSLLLGPYIAATVFGMKIPDALLASASQIPKINSIRDRIVSDMEHLDTRKSTERIIQQFIRPRVLDKIRYSAAKIFIPSPVDWYTLRLHSRWSFLYYGYRPCRLFWRQMVRLKFRRPTRS